ncbi:hypothetical protein HYALB_00010446 [Hymenoscyphus albidus]|uniref:Uncharacterized protein n=1 Tax=Hymenoscyphus albidus TaxID=595503 RepID=A0A9N9LHJ1_9HELO|nr:hypothetical protein HYALB_00010446 [Hymenoscyphus albidus]
MQGAPSARISHPAAEGKKRQTNCSPEVNAGGQLSIAHLHICQFLGLARALDATSAPLFNTVDYKTPAIPPTTNSSTILASSQAVLSALSS